MLPRYRTGHALVPAAGGGSRQARVQRRQTRHRKVGGNLPDSSGRELQCRQNLGRREAYGKWTNVWWAKTDDDSGNTDVFVSDVCLKGGDNNAPLPGLPVC